jgi:hypothetical protein
MSFVRVVALAALAATASAFVTSPASSMMLRSSSAAISRPSGASVFRSARVSLSNGLRMQSEDDKAKASGIALATVGLIFSKFSLLVAVLAGGAAVYAGECLAVANVSSFDRTGT